MKSTDLRPIGIFDSGIGGTSILREVQLLLPQEETIYLSDSANAPYGQKSVKAINELSIKNTAFLLEQNCKLIVVACNTATTNAIKHLRAQYPIPFIGIEPAIKPAALKSRNKHIGILATKGTLNSSLFATTASQLEEDIIIIEQIGEGLVELIEHGQLHSKQMTALLKKHLAPFQKHQVDELVLGCTHYPYLIPQIQAILGPNVHIIDSGAAVAKQTKMVLEQHKLLNTSNTQAQHWAYSNKDAELLEQFIAKKTTTQVSFKNF
ncbi:glutamate racemase [Polaribacter pacificus]|uniref:Glutamate racemase n=1 Tax=Polaribacter pacificus TaxID=1775173 RepID=A0A917HUC6_9FLAO|nr:glutamate racemase [Polaribacter pacificus]GGG90975.1 glutamate racemase [Polaribacter pacificus]